MKPWTLCLLYPSQISFPLHKNVLLPLQCGDLYMTNHGCRPWTAVLCLSQRNLPMKKINQQSMKEMENFIQANLRIIPLRESFRKLWGLFRPLEVKAQLYKFLRQKVVGPMTYYWQFTCSTPIHTEQVMSHGLSWSLTRLRRKVIS